MKDNKQNPVKVPIKPILVKKANSTTSQAQSTPQPSSQSTSSTNKPVTTATNVTNKALPIAANQTAPVSLLTYLTKLLPKLK